MSYPRITIKEIEELIERDKEQFTKLGNMLNNRNANYISNKQCNIIMNQYKRLCFNYDKIRKFLTQNKYNNGGELLTATAILFACFKGKIDVVKWMYYSNLIPESKCFYMKAASNSGNLELLKFVVEEMGCPMYMEVDDEDDNCWWAASSSMHLPSWKTSQMDHLRCLQYVINKGAPITSQTYRMSKYGHYNNISEWLKKNGYPT